MYTRGYFPKCYTYLVCAYIAYTCTYVVHLFGKLVTISGCQLSWFTAMSLMASPTASRQSFYSLFFSLNNRFIGSFNWWYFHCYIPNTACGATPAIHNVVHINVHVATLLVHCAY